MNKEAWKDVGELILYGICLATAIVGLYGLASRLVSRERQADFEQFMSQLRDEINNGNE